MRKGWAIKKSVYQGSDGVQVDSSQEVKLFDYEREAVIAAANSGGEVVPIIRPNESSKSKNQSWMRRDQNDRRQKRKA